MEQETLYKFFDGRTSFEEEVAIRQWVERSLENKRIFLKERKLFDAMILLGEDNGIQTETIKGQRKFSSLRTEVLKIAGIVLLTLGASYLFQQLGQADDLLAMQTISVPAGQRVNITLPDGTNVWLNARTTIQYPLAFDRKERKVSLDGEAYFDVTKNEERPFVVQTKMYDVEVFGTKFNVDAYADKHQFETVLMEGSVKVVSQEDPAQAVMLQPNSKVYRENGRLKVASVDNYNPYRWKEGLICFDEESFEAIMKDFEKYYGVSIEISNRKALTYFYTGKFRQVDGIDYALRILQRDIDFTYTRDDDKRIIYIK